MGDGQAAATGTQGRPPAVRPHFSVPTPASKLEIGVFLALFALLLVRQLALPPIVGLADNGDYLRVMSPVGLDHLPREWAERYFYFLNTRYVHVGGLRLTHFVSSELSLAAAAAAAHRAIAPHGIFDLRILGLVHAAAFLAGLALVVVAARTLPLLARLVLYACLLFVFGDVGYVCYFNSFYSEPASLIGFAWLVGTALLVLRRRAGPGARTPWAGLFLAVSCFFVTAKLQNGALAFPLGVYAWRLFSGSRPRRRLGVALAATLGLLGAVYSGPGHTRQAREVGAYLMVFHEILPRVPDRPAVLASLGLDPGLSRLLDAAGHGPQYDPAVLQDQHVTRLYLRVARFYLAHPAMLRDLLVAGARNACSLRPPEIGNFEKRAGFPPGTKARAFGAWSRWKERALPKSGWTVAGFAVVNALAIGLCWRRRDGGRRGGIAELHLLLVVMAALQFLVVVAGRGSYEIIKHLLLFNALFDACLILTVVEAGAWLSASGRGRTPARPGGQPAG
jgi:hypothetical protein